MTDKIKIHKKNKKLESSSDDEITEISIELTNALEESKLIRLKVESLIKELDIAIDKKYLKKTN